MKMNELRVFGIPWHTAHQYELSKLFKSFDLLTNIYREWGTVSRPIPDNMKMVIEFDRSKYDLAILHIDQQCLDPRIGKGRLFRDMKELTEGMPRVVINHMTPFDDKLEEEQVIAGIKAEVGDIPMIVNSQTARAQWGWGHPIIHGLTASEWWDLPKEPRIITSLSAGGMNKAYGRELLHVTMQLLNESGIELIWLQTMHKCNTWDEYREYIGRSLVYFNPTLNSPMPRSRTEAMLSGACIVSTGTQDWDRYIEDGVNGFIIPWNPNAAAKLLTRLVTTDIKLAREVGQRGKKMAMERLSHERWAKDWETLLSEIGVVS